MYKRQVRNLAAPRNRLQVEAVGNRRDPAGGNRHREAEAAAGIPLRAGAAGNRRRWEAAEVDSPQEGEADSHRAADSLSSISPDLNRGQSGTQTVPIVLSAMV